MPISKIGLQKMPKSHRVSNDMIQNHFIPAVPLNPESGNCPPGGGLTRRAFTKRSGGATIASLVAWNTLGAAAADESSYFDISDKFFALAHVYNDSDVIPGKPSAYRESVPQDFPMSGVFVTTPASSSVKVKLIAWIDPDPWPRNPCPSDAYWEFYAEVSGTFPNPTSYILLHTDQMKFRAVCDTSNGAMTGFISTVATSADFASTPVTGYIPGYEHRISVRLKDLVVEPVGGGARSTLVRGYVETKIESKTIGGTSWSNYSSPVSHRVEFQFSAHRHQ